jgi:hypothetical protein
MFERCDDILGFQAEADLDAKTLSGEENHNRQCANSSTIDQLVRDKIHPPDIVRPSGRTLRMSVHRGDMTPWSLAP